MDYEKQTALERHCNDLRKTVLQMIHLAQSGHPGGSLSITEILAVLYYDRMRLHADQADGAVRDSLILSKGHAAPMLYAILADLGYCSKEELSTLRCIGSRLQGHPCACALDGVSASTGPLGLGLSYGIGCCFAKRMNGEDGRIYVIMGDGELQEGIVWEAAMTAAKYKLDNLIAIVDRNGVQLDGTNDEIMPLGSLEDKFSAFGWRVLQCDGHDITALSSALAEAEAGDGRPTVLLAETVKGKGVSFMEHQSAWHGRVITDEELRSAMLELEENAI